MHDLDDSVTKVLEASEYKDFIVHKTRTWPWNGCT